VIRLRGGAQPDDGETEYERERREKQAKNLEMMKSLGLDVDAGVIKQKVQEKKKRQRKKWTQPEDDAHARRYVATRYLQSSTTVSFLVLLRIQRDTKYGGNADHTHRTRAT
jgi:hypothetical protein